MGVGRRMGAGGSCITGASAKLPTFARPVLGLVLVLVVRVAVGVRGHFVCHGHRMPNPNPCQQL